MRSMVFKSGGNEYKVFFTCVGLAIGEDEKPKKLKDMLVFDVDHIENCEDVDSFLKENKKEFKEEAIKLVLSEIDKLR